MGEVEREIEGVKYEEEQEGSNKQRGSFVHGFFFFSLTHSLTHSFSLYGNNDRVVLWSEVGAWFFFLSLANEDRPVGC